MGNMNTNTTRTITISVEVDGQDYSKTLSEQELRDAYATALQLS